ncbi:hypothetical protein BDR26DRAFT_822639 [Obelidium mucronatum]|nr:hypothetical protein BDR26DRAFT_822639 [Obelidium mucronatum]
MEAGNEESLSAQGTSHQQTDTQSGQTSSVLQGTDEDVSIEAQRYALDSLITTIKPLLPRINNHIQTKPSRESAPENQKGDFLAMISSSDGPPPPTLPEPAPARSQEPMRRKSFKDLFSKSATTSVVSPETHSSLGKLSLEKPGDSAQPKPRESLASAPMSDDTLALALASLCSALYRVLDTLDVNRATNEGQSTSNNGANTKTTAEIQELSNHAKEIAQLQSMSGNASLSPEQKLLWLEIDKMMALVHTLCVTRCHVLEKPPSYDNQTTASLRRGSMLSTEELHNVAAAIDRVIRMTPKMFDQTVTLSARQERMMDEAALTGLIDRLFQGREDFQAQRASPDSFINMSRLVDQIVKSSKRSMDNQRVQVSESYQQKMESAKLMNVVEKQAKTRFKNQDWVSKETQLINELAQLQVNLMNACKGMANQRVELTEAKEKEIFLGRLVGRMNADSTFDNQTAFSISRKKKDDEIDKVCLLYLLGIRCLTFRFKRS